MVSLIKSNDFSTLYGRKGHFDVEIIDNETFVTWVIPSTTNNNCVMCAHKLPALNKFNTNNDLI